jgi:hypothetical protein
MAAAYDRLETAIDEYVIPLRLARGYRQDLFDRMCDALREYFKEYESSDCIPRDGVITLVGIFEAIHSCDGLYRGDEQQLVIASAVIANELIYAALSRDSMEPA